MRLALLSIVGPLDRYGYQNVYPVALESFSLFAERIYLVSSTRSNSNVDAIKKQFPKITYISNEESWFDLDDDGNEIFDVFQYNTNLDVGVAQIKKDDMDVVFLAAINNYIPEKAIPLLRQKAEKMLSDGRPAEWIYRRFQLGDRLFVPDMKIIQMINMRVSQHFHFRYDWAESPDGEKLIRQDHSLFYEGAQEAVVDCAMEMTLDDLRDKMNFTRSYAQLNPNAPKEFTKITHIENYYFPKFLKLEITKDSLDRFGNMVTKNHQSDFVSYYILRNYLDPWRMLNKVLAGRYRWLLNLSVSVKKLLFAWRKKLIANAHARYCRFFKI